MANQQHIEAVSGGELLELIRRRVVFGESLTIPLFRTPALAELEERLSKQIHVQGGSRFIEWQNYKSAVALAGNDVTVHVLPAEIQRFKDSLQKLERAYEIRSLIQRGQILQDLVLLGQELLRRKYFALLMHSGKKVILSSAATLVIETGASAIQILGRAPAGPRYAYRKFGRKDTPQTAMLGVEILSSGAFPDWSDTGLSDLRKEGDISRMGFENVIEAALDTPRTRVLNRLIEEGRDVPPLMFPVFLRSMLDLELMRLGQATTPGTYNMLLNSSYHGALLVDHSTNVSEQVQIIYEEENWKPAHTIDPAKDANDQARKAAACLLKHFFRSKSASLIHRDHPREARIEFAAGTDPTVVRDFFRFLMGYLTKGMNVAEEGFTRIASVHKVTPVVRLSGVPQQEITVKRCVDLIKSMGLKEFYLMADSTRHEPGLLQYFASADVTNGILDYARKQRVTVRDGRTVDMVATANKAIEAAAGAIESGQGCIKVGLLGLTYEEMKEFVRRVKRGLGVTYKRQENQFLVFIGIVDKPIVTDDRVYTKAYDIGSQFIDLMRRTRHDILLIDTMNKGAKDPRLVDAGDDRCGHLTADQLRSLVRTSHAARCDLWVAGSYTEEQVYQAAMDDPKERPGLICLGGSERSFGGLRLDPREAYTPLGRLKKEDAKLVAKVECDADVKFILSRENKLARDTGLVVGELRRRKQRGWRKVDAMRNRYLLVRQRYFDALEKVANDERLPTRNIDTLVLRGEMIMGNLPEKTRKSIEVLKKRFEKERGKYVESVADEMMKLFADEWIPREKRS